MVWSAIGPVSIVPVGPWASVQLKLSVRSCFHEQRVLPSKLQSNCDCESTRKDFHHLDQTPNKAVNENKNTASRCQCPAIACFEFSKAFSYRFIKYWVPAFYPIPTMFSKAFLIRAFEIQDCAVKVEC